MSIPVDERILHAHGVATGYERTAVGVLHRLYDGGPASLTVVVGSDGALRVAIECNNCVLEIAVPSGQWPGIASGNQPTAPTAS